MKRIKTYPFLSFFLLLFSLFIIGCNKDDSNPDKPKYFEITISDITFQSAKADWTSSNGVEPSILKYSIYLNDSLLAENLTDTFYALTDLDNSMDYTVKVEAKNEFGTTTSSQDFTTLQPSSLRLTSYKQDNYEYILNYNQENLLTYRGDPSPNGYTNIDYTYNQNNEILTEHSRYRDATGGPSALLTYQYLNNMPESLSIVQTGEDFRNEYDFDFQSLLNYTYILNEIYDFNTDHFSYYSVQLELDSNNNIITYNKVNTQTSATKIVNLEYSNGNLTKITNNGNVLEIAYDTANNWHTYKSRFMPDIYNNTANDLGGFIYYPNFLGENLKEIPQFYDFINTNNPLEYKYNGQVLTSFQYEYNSSNYPTKITIPEKGVTIDLEYEAVY